MHFAKVQFVTSSTTYTEDVAAGKPVYAFAGRSNVGKSSLINSLCGRKKLAKTSATPGKTATINYFLVDDAWYLVDLPGYGWAQTSKDTKRRWDHMVKEYVLFSAELVHLFLLVDSRHPPQEADLAFLNWLGRKKVSCSLVFTKIDKVNNTLLTKHITAFQQRMLTTWISLPAFFTTSATKSKGRTSLLSYIAQINNTLLNNKVSN